MRTKRILSGLTALSLLALPSTAPAVASEAPGDGEMCTATTDTVQRIGYAPSTYDFTDFFGQFDTGLRSGLAERGVNYDIFVQAPQDELQVEQQRNIIENLLALGIDYLVAVPTRLEAHYESYRLVNEAGVPLVIGQFVEPIPEDVGIEVLSYAGASLEDAGEMAAEYIIDQVGPGGKIVILSGQAGGAVDEGRVSHAIPILEEAGVEILGREYADFQRDLAFNATEAMLTAHPEIDLIYGGSSAMALGALQAVEAAGRDVPVIGQGGILEEVQAVLDERMLATILRDPSAMGRAAAEAVCLHLEGREDEIPQVVELPHVILDSCESIVENYNPLLFEAAGAEWPEC